jgi:hypothetical protein
MLRKILIMTLVLTGIIYWSCSAKSDSKAGDESSMPKEGTEVTQLPTTTLTFKDSIYDFGESVKGKEVVHVFEFTNTGKENLIIADAKAGCGCTVPEWPKEAIKPGESGAITVKYNGSGSGQVTKTVTVTANTNPATRVLTIKGYVKEEVNGPFLKDQSH